MTTVTITPTVMRTVVTLDDSFRANEFLTAYIGDEPWKLDDLVPDGRTFRPIAIAEDGSAAEFDVYSGSGWDLDKTELPLGRIILQRTPALSTS